MPWPERNGGDGWTSILFDWIAAILLIALFLLAERFEAMPRGPEKLAAANLHAAVGMTTPFEKSHHLHQVLEETHAFVAHVFVLLFILHVAGAPKNLLLDQSGVFLRMLRSGRSST